MDDRPLRALTVSESNPRFPSIHDRHARRFSYQRAKMDSESYDRSWLIERERPLPAVRVKTQRPDKPTLPAGRDERTYAGADGRWPHFANASHVLYMFSMRTPRQSKKDAHAWPVTVRGLVPEGASTPSVQTMICIAG